MAVEDAGDQGQKERRRLPQATVGQAHGQGGLVGEAEVGGE